MYKHIYIIWTWSNYTYIYLYINIYLNIQIYIDINLPPSVLSPSRGESGFTGTYIYIYIHTYIYIYIYIYICIYKCTFIHKFDIYIHDENEYKKWLNIYIFKSPTFCFVTITRRIRIPGCRCTHIYTHIHKFDIYTYKYT
jgi:hypothetical protein